LYYRVKLGGVGGVAAVNVYSCVGGSLPTLHGDSAAPTDCCAAAHSCACADDDDDDGEGVTFTEDNEEYEEGSGTGLSAREQDPTGK
jgi:hypothetical protein